MSPAWSRSPTICARWGCGLRLTISAKAIPTCACWSELRPEFVKIDKYFVHQIERHAEKVQTIKGLARLAEVFGTTLVAEGVETDVELRIVRDLGIELAQGYFLGQPQPRPAAEVLGASCCRVVEHGDRRAAGADPRRWCRVHRASAAVQVPPLSNTDHQRRSGPDLRGRPGLPRGRVVEGSRPIGLISRQAFVDRYAKPSSRSCTAASRR